MAPQFPLTSSADDVARLRQVLELQDGPSIVVGHSYGGQAYQPAAQLFMANRAHAHITEVPAGHLSMVSQPGAVATVITEAAQAVVASDEQG